MSMRPITRLWNAMVAAAALAVAGCTSDNGGIQATTDAVYSLVTDGLFGDDKRSQVPAKIERKMAADLPYASIGVTIDDNPQFLFVLANQNAMGDLYTLGYQVSVVLRGGRVIRTQGLIQDVLGGRWEGEDIVQAAARSNSPVSGVRWFELNTHGIGTHEARCTATGLGVEIVTVLGTPIPARHVTEACKVSTLKWQFTNEFWIVPETGQVWMSVQHIGPKGNPLIIEQFRPAGPAKTEAPSG